MAQPQGLNVPAIITTAIITTILAGTVFEGVHAYYNHFEKAEEERKWDLVKQRTIDKIRDEQEVNNLKKFTTIPIDQAMKQVAENGGKMPSTKPAKS